MVQLLRRSLSALPPLLLAGLAASAAAAPPPAGVAQEAPFLRANAAAMHRMMMDMEVRPSGDVDRDFARMMIPHHQGGIDMARALLRHGRNKEMRALARNIIAKQQEEIDAMRRFIAAR